MRVNKQMLGNTTLKSILYLDQNFFSALHRGVGGHAWAKAPMSKINELLDLQLLAIPYSHTHISEADLNGEYRDDLVKFIQRVSRGHHFEPYWSIEAKQILKAYHAFLDNAPAQFEREQSEALCPSVHDWEGDFIVTVFSGAIDSGRRSAFKQQAVDELLDCLPKWANKRRTFEEDMELEISDAARILVDHYTDQEFRLSRGDFSALIDSPIDASTVRDMLYVAQVKQAPQTTVGAFFRSEHFAQVPSVQLSARFFSAFKQKLRSGIPPDPTSKTAREKHSGLLSDAQHAATYAPYCDAFFTADKTLARLMKQPCVGVEQEFGCKVFSVENMDEFLGWLEYLKSQMTPQHAEDLRRAYPKRFPLNDGFANRPQPKEPQST